MPVQHGVCSWWLVGRAEEGTAAGWRAAPSSPVWLLWRQRGSSVVVQVGFSFVEGQCDSIKRLLIQSAERCQCEWNHRRKKHFCTFFIHGTFLMVFIFTLFCFFLKLEKWLIQTIKQPIKMTFSFVTVYNLQFVLQFGCNSYMFLQILQCRGPGE